MMNYYSKTPPWVTEPSDLLNVRCYITNGHGSLDINDHKAFELAGDTRNSRQITHRKQEVASAYVPGSFTVNHVKENIMESLSIYVRGYDHHQLHVNIRRLEDAITQPVYYIKWHIEEHAEMWRCQPADYQIESSREFQHSTLAKFKAQIPRYPELLDSSYDIQGPNAVPR